MKEINNIKFDAPNGQTYDISGRDALRIILLAHTLPPAAEPKRIQLLQLLDKYIDCVQYSIEGATLRSIQYTVTNCDQPEQDIRAAIESCLNCYPIPVIIEHYIQNEHIKLAADTVKAEPALEQPTEPTPEDSNKIHSISRTLARDIARNTGRDTSNNAVQIELPLHAVLEAIDQQRQVNPEMERQYWSHKAAQLASKLMLEYPKAPKHTDGRAIIYNLPAIAEAIGTDNKYLKKLILLLASYTYPHSQLENIEGKEMIGVTFARLFDITLIYDKGRQAQLDSKRSTYSEIMKNLVTNEEPIGMLLKPSREYEKDIQGKHLGSIRVGDNFLAFSNDLTELAYKLLHFSISQKPAYKIGEAKLLEFLNLHKQRKNDGKPRLRKKIQNALQELKNKGHLLTFSIELAKDGTAQYSWQYSNKIVKHKAEYLNPSETEYIDYKDTSIPLEKRRARKAEWMQKEKKMTPAKAKAQAEKSIPE